MRTFEIEQVVCLFSLARCFLETTIYSIPFVLKYKRKRYFFLTLPLCLLSCIAIIYGLSFLNAFFYIEFFDVQALAYGFLSTCCSFVISCAILVAFFLLFQESRQEIILCWCRSVSMQIFVGMAFSLLLNFAGVDDLLTNSFFHDDTVGARDWIIDIGIHLLIFGGMSWAFIPKNKIGAESNRNVAFIVFITILICVFFTGIGRQYESESFALKIIVKCFYLFTSLLIIILCSGVFEQSKFKQELETTEQILHREKQQFESMKSNIEVINIKCHDLKHKLNALEGKLDSADVESLKQAIEIYNSNIKTGNEILDTVLYEKQLYCDSKGLKLNVNADGDALAFVSASHLYSLIGNAIDNAIEAEEKLSELDKKIIEFSVVNDNGTVEIDLLNFCLPDAQNRTTSKQDKGRHGYGIKSMKYVVDYYGGTMTTNIEDGIYELRIALPHPSM